MRKEFTTKEKQQLVNWARRSVHGLDESAMFIGILDDRKELGAARIEFTLQLGHCLLTDKTIIIPAPHGMELPKKLEAVADHIVRYDPQNMESLHHALTKLFTEIGINKQ